MPPQVDVLFSRLGTERAGNFRLIGTFLLHPVALRENLGADDSPLHTGSFSGEKDGEMLACVA